MSVAAHVPGPRPACIRSPSPSVSDRDPPFQSRPTLVPLPPNALRLFAVHRRRSASRGLAGAAAAAREPPSQQLGPNSLFLHVLDEYARGTSPLQAGQTGRRDEVGGRASEDSDSPSEGRSSEADSLKHELSAKDVREEWAELRAAAQQPQNLAANRSSGLGSSGLENARDGTHLSREAPSADEELMRWQNFAEEELSEKRGPTEVQGRLRGLGDEGRTEKSVVGSTDAQSMVGRSSDAQGTTELQTSRERPAWESGASNRRPWIIEDDEDTHGQQDRSSFRVEGFLGERHGLKVGRQVYLTGEQDYMRWMPREEQDLEGSVAKLALHEDLGHSLGHTGESGDCMQPMNGNGGHSRESEDVESELATEVEEHLSVEPNEPLGGESSQDLLAEFLKTRSEQWGDDEGGQGRRGAHSLDDHSRDSLVVHNVKTMIPQPKMDASHNHDENSWMNSPRDIHDCTSPEGISTPLENSLEIACSSAADDERNEQTILTKEIVSHARNLPVNASLEIFLDRFHDEISNSDGNTVLQSLGEERLAWPMLHFFQWMRIHEPSLLDSRSFCILFTQLGRVGMVDQALLQYKNMPNSQDFHCVQVYNSLLGALVRCNRAEHMGPILRTMEDRNIHRDTVTYSILINATKKGSERVAEVWCIFNQMLKQGIRPSISVYGSLIKAFCDEGHLKEALLAFLSMERMEISPNVIIYNMLIDAHGKALQLDQAEGLVVEMKSRGLSPTQSTYNTLINAYGRSGQVATAEELLVEMQREGLRPNVATYTSLISAYGKQRLSEEAASVFLRMNRNGLVPTTHTYTALINAYAEGGWHDKAQRAFDNMTRAGLKPTVETLTALLDAYRRAGDLEMVRSIWSTMRRDGCELTKIAYRTVMDAFSKHGQWADARDVMEEFRKHGLGPDTMIFNMLLNAYARGGMHTKLPKVMLEMRSVGCEPNAYTYCTIIYAFIRLRDFTNAFKYNKEMRQKGMLPDRRTYKKMKFILDAKYALKLENDSHANAGQKASGQVSSRKNPQRAKRLFKRYQKYGPLRGSERTKALWKEKENQQCQK